MIRDTRKINIETDFFYDEDICSPKLHQETFQSNLLIRDKAAIFFYNILDTLRLQRIIHAFAILINNSRSQIRKYSSRQIFANNKYNNTKPPSVVYHNYHINNDFSANQEVDVQVVQRRKNMPLRKQKRPLSYSLNAKNEKQSNYLRESRKRILKSISKTLQDQPLTDHQRIQAQTNRVNISKKSQIHQNQNQKNLPQNKPSQHMQIKSRLLKIEKLMKNIRQEKDKQEPVIVREKRLVAQLPKRQKNNKQMIDFMQQLKSLRTQIHQIKQINEQILHHSRERSVKSSKVETKSQKQPLNLHSFPYKDIKRSQVLQDHSSKQKSKHSSPKYTKHARYDKQNRKQTVKKSLTEEKNYKVQRKQLTINNQTNLSILPQKTTQNHKNYIKIQQNAENPKTIQYFRQPIPKIVGKKQIRKQQNYYNPNLQNKKQKQPTQQISQIESKLTKGRGTAEKSLQQDIRNKPYIRQMQRQAYEQVQQKVNSENYVTNTYSNQNSYKPQIRKQQNRNQYKLSPWYKQYGSPLYTSSLTKNIDKHALIQPSYPISHINPLTNQTTKPINQYNKPSRQTVSFSADNQNLPKQIKNINYKQITNKGLELHKLDQITDKFSYSNVNSARTSNYSKQDQLAKQYNKYNQYNQYNYQDNNYNSSLLDKGYKYTSYYDTNQNNNFNTNKITNTNVNTNVNSRSDYTNPDLLKQLNIGPFPKSNPSWYDSYKQNKSYLPTQQNTKYNHQYQQYPIQGNKQLTPNNHTNLQSFKSISDNNSYQSYTYSNNSSAPTSMAKLQQQYEDVINSPSRKQYPAYQNYSNIPRQINYDNYTNDQYHSQYQYQNKVGGQQQYEYEYSPANANNQPIQNHAKSSNINIDDLEDYKKSNSYGGYSFQQIYEDYVKNK